MREIIIQASKPFKNKPSSHHYDDEDISTMYCKKVFEAITITLKDIYQDFPNDAKVTSWCKLMSYDAFESILPVIHIETKAEPGKMTTKYRKPTIDELSQAIAILEDRSKGPIKSDQPEKYINLLKDILVQEKRDANINTLLNNE